MAVHKPAVESERPQGDVSIKCACCKKVLTGRDQGPTTRPMLLHQHYMELQAKGKHGGAFLNEADKGAT